MRNAITPNDTLINRLRNIHDPLSMEAADRIDILEAIIATQESILDEYHTTIASLKGAINVNNGSDRV